MRANEIFRKSLGHLKDTQPLSYFWVNLVFIAELSHHLWLVSLNSPWWKNYAQVTPWKFLLNFTFSLVIQAVLIGVLRQVVFILLSNIYDEAVSRKQLTAKRCYLFLQNSSIIDVWERPKCASTHSQKSARIVLETWEISEVY